jgi:hypothetical protein
MLIGRDEELRFAELSREPLLCDLPLAGGGKNFAKRPCDPSGAPTPAMAASQLGPVRAVNLKTQYRKIRQPRKLMACRIGNPGAVVRFRCRMTALSVGLKADGS